MKPHNFITIALWCDRENINFPLDLARIAASFIAELRLTNKEGFRIMNVNWMANRIIT